MSYSDYTARGRGYHRDWDDDGLDDGGGSGGGGSGSSGRRYGSRGDGGGGDDRGSRRDGGGYGDDDDGLVRTHPARVSGRDDGEPQSRSRGASRERRPRRDPERSWLSDGGNALRGHLRRSGGRERSRGREHSRGREDSRGRERSAERRRSVERERIDERERSAERERPAGRRPLSRRRHDDERERGGAVRERISRRRSHSRRSIDDDDDYRGGRENVGGSGGRRRRHRSSSLTSSSSGSDSGGVGGRAGRRWSPPRHARGGDADVLDEEPWRPRRAASDPRRADSGGDSGSRLDWFANGTPSVAYNRSVSRGLGGDAAAAAIIVPPPPVNAGGSSGSGGDGMPVRVFCGTWNVNGGPPAAGVDLRPWLTATGAPAGGGSRGGGRRGTHDLYMVAFQEVQPLSGRTAITTDTERGRRWEAAVGAALGGADAVTRIASRQLVGILLVVFASNALAPAVSNVLVTDAGVGLMRAAGNKGAVAARFVLYGTTSVAVVSCHLAAHDHATERRNEDYHQVLREAVFEEGGPRYENADWGTLRAAVNSGVTKARSKVRAAGAAYGPSGSSAFGGGSGGEDLYGPGVRLVEADALFWLGDLNYRIDLPADVVLDCIAKRDWPTLRDADQLTAARAMGAVFRGFSEGVLDFAPTYKHATHSDGYALHEEGGVKRTPAWCDRILWRAHEGGRPAGRVVLHAYRRHEVLSSDHRPVSATFTLTAREL